MQYEKSIDVFRQSATVFLCIISIKRLFKSTYYRVIRGLEVISVEKKKLYTSKEAAKAD